MQAKVSEDSGKLPSLSSRAIGFRIKDARVQAGMSQGQLGDLVGVTFQQIQKYEKGTNRVASDRLQRIADAVGKPIAFFFIDATKVIAPADDELLRVIIKWLGTGTAPRRILAALPPIRDTDLDLAAAFLERLASPD